MNENVVRTETLYTYEAAISRYEREKHHSWLCRQRELKAIRQRQKAERKYYIKQKVTGVMLLLVSITLLIFGIGEGIFIIPFAVYLTVTKNKLLYSSEHDPEYEEV